MSKPPPPTSKDMREMREQFGLSQARFGELMGVNRLAAWTWENGEHNPSGTAIRLARLYQRLHLLGVPVSLLLRDDITWLDDYIKPPDRE